LGYCVLLRDGEPGLMHRQQRLSVFDLSAAGRERGRRCRRPGPSGQAADLAISFR
jgi:hypothetical protein